MAALSGPRRGPRLAEPARQLVVLLHAYESTGEEFIHLAPLLQRFAPHAAFVAPNGPVPCDGPKGGFQWWPPTGGDPEKRISGARRVRALLDGFIDEELARHGLSEDRLALAGFSQGAMAALYVGLRRAGPPAGVISFSGDLIDDESLETGAPVRPPVLLLHGAADPVLPLARLHRTEDILRRCGIEPSVHVSPTLGHGVGLDGIRRAGAFLRSAFA